MTAVQELIKKIKVRIPFFQYSIYQDDFDAAVEKEKRQIIDAANFLPHDEQNELKTAEDYYNETYNNKNKIKAEKLVNDYMQFCNNNYYDAQKSALFATELMIEVCNTCLLYTKQPIRENDDIYNNLVKVKNELKKLKPISEIAKEKQSERFMESVRNSGVFEKIMEGKMCAIHNEALNEDGLCNTCLENSNK